MQKKIDKKIIDFLNNEDFKYDKENDIIYVNDIEASDYIQRVIVERIKITFKEELTIKDIKEILSDNGSFEVVDRHSNLSEFKDLINGDDNIKEDYFSAFLKWKDEKALWKTDKDGLRTSLVECLDNIIGFLEHFPETKDKIKFNNIRNLVEYKNRQVTDNDYHTFINYINKYFIREFSKLKMVKDAVDNIGNKNKYNAWVDYFNKLKYIDDGIDYIDYTIKNVLCCEEQEKYYDLYYETLKIMCLAVMSRIYNKELYKKPIKFDTVTVFCSENGGTGKTTFPERLFDINNDGNSYCYVVAGDSFQPSNKDFIERSHQCTCLLLDELSMARAKVTSVKGYITQRDDIFRKSYGYNNESHIRGFIITATSNNNDILKDYTTANERRWAIIKVSEDPNNYKKVNEAFDNGFRDKLWTFIKHLYKTTEFKLYMTDERLIELETQIQRGYKASNNEDYNTIIYDLLEREYGFYDEQYVDVDLIVNQYKSNDAYNWCRQHNEEVEIKINKSLKGEYIMKPDDRQIKYWGKIDRIQKTVLYNILKKIGIDYTKPSLAAEMRDSGIWNGYDNKPCRIAGQLVKAYWRVDKESRMMIDFNHEQQKQGILPF